MESFGEQDKVALSQDNKTTGLNSGNIFDRLQTQTPSPRPLDAILNRAEHTASAPDQAPTCGPNYEYMRYVESAARNMYDPSSLGNINALDHKYDCEIKNGTDVLAFADKALTVSGDRFNHVMTPEEVRSMERANSGGYTGIGLVIKPADKVDGQTPVGASVVEKPVTGRPAEAAGIQAGDTLMSVDGTDVRNLNPAQITDLITNGQAGTKVDLVVDRHGTKVERVITRQNIDAPVVHDKDLGNGITYLQIDNFMSEKTSDELADAMRRHADARAFIVDVRNNPGGLVDQALKSAELFVDTGTLMTSKERKESSPSNPVYGFKTMELQKNQLYTSLTYSDNRPPTYYTDVRQPNLAKGRPVAVLTNGESASASEIFTGAVHDTARDATIGTTTYGKGIGQTIVRGMPEGGWLKVTSLHYETPSGVWPGDADKNKIGLKSDYYVENAPQAKAMSADDNQLNSAVTYLQARLQAKKP